jgi:two-component system, OmpR family, sensor histidine kinase CiaH
MFRSARIKLTAWYLLIIMSISIPFSVVIYQVLKNELDRFERISRFRFERRIYESNVFPKDVRERVFPTPVVIVDPQVIQEARLRLEIILVIINGAIFIVAGGLGYLLAGRTLKPIAEMVEEQNRFISDSSHELRTPLTSLKSSMEVSLRDKNFTLKEAKTLIKESIMEVNKLQSLSDSLLQLAQYQKPSDHVVFEKIMLDDVIRQAIHKIEPLAKAKNINIQARTQPISLQGDKYSLVDLFVILLDNAIKYSPKGSDIGVHAKKIGETATISVKDQGIGIATPDLARIFERFYRADAARSKNEKGGYGLGLSIAQKITQMHGGTIQATSTLKKGSVFTVGLPV